LDDEDEAKKSIYVLRANKINKMKKVKKVKKVNPVGQFGLLDLTLRIIRSLLGKKKKEKIDATEQNSSCA
jgi:hypothetical protein